MDTRSAQIVDTYLGFWSDEVLVAFLLVDFGGVIRGIGGNLLNSADPLANRRYGEEFALRLLRACGAVRWSELDGLPIDVLFDAPFPWGRAVGVENQPDKPGERFLFDDLSEAPVVSAWHPAAVRAALEEAGVRSQPPALPTAPVPTRDLRSESRPSGPAPRR